jgi:hypothetical protein
MLPLLKKADVIIPLAALVGAPLCNLDPVGATTTNREAITMMLKHVSQEQRILMPTTNSAYGSAMRIITVPKSLHYGRSRNMPSIKSRQRKS